MMKVQNRKLDFDKSVIVELNNNQLLDVDGGGSPLVISIAIVATYIAMTY